MARDELLSGGLARGGPALAVRAHGWLRPTLSTGRLQALPGELAEQARELGVDVVRRPTGGGWLLHLPGDLAVTLAVAGPLRAGEFRRAARLVAGALARGLAGCGLPAAVFTGSAPPARAAACFLRADRDEVVVGGTKVAGVALARQGRGAVVQSALPLVREPEALREFARAWDPARQLAADALAGAPRDRLWEETVAALASAAGAERGPAAWTADLLREADDLREAKYLDEEFTRSGRAAVTR
ncbi:MAG: hypothetical protein KBD01_06605 [Acidobacteria bacterium]|nr:hypothetical protein [Acidobacteriota bacterium]